MECQADSQMQPPKSSEVPDSTSKPVLPLAEEPATKKEDISELKKQVVLEGANGILNENESMNVEDKDQCAVTIAKNVNEDSICGFGGEMANMMKTQLVNVFPGEDDKLHNEGYSEENCGLNNYDKTESGTQFSNMEKISMICNVGEVLGKDAEVKGDAEVAPEFCGVEQLGEDVNQLIQTLNVRKEDADNSPENRNLRITSEKIVVTTPEKDYVDSSYWCLTDIFSTKKKKERNISIDGNILGDVANTIEDDKAVKESSQIQEVKEIRSTNVKVDQEMASAEIIADIASREDLESERMNHVLNHEVREWKKKIESLELAKNEAQEMLKGKAKTNMKYMSTMNEVHEKEIRSLIDEHAQEMKKLRKEHMQAVHDAEKMKLTLTSRYEEEKSYLNDSHCKRMKEVIDAHGSDIAEQKSKLYEKEQELCDRVKEVENRHHLEYSQAQAEHDVKVDEIILQHDKRVLVLNDLLMGAEIKMNENLKTMESSNARKLKLLEESHEDARRQMTEALVQLEKSYEVRMSVASDTHKRAANKLKDARHREVSQLKENYDVVVKEYAKVKIDLDDCKNNHSLETSRVKESHLAEIARMEEKISSIKEEMKQQLETSQNEHMESLSSYEDTHICRRTNLVKGHATEVLQLKKELKWVTLEKQEVFKNIEEMKLESDCVLKAKVDAIVKERNALLSMTNEMKDSLAQWEKKHEEACSNVKNLREELVSVQSRSLVVLPEFMDCTGMCAKNTVALTMAE